MITLAWFCSVLDNNDKTTCGEALSCVRSDSQLPQSMGLEVFCFVFSITTMHGSDEDHTRGVSCERVSDCKLV